MVGIDCLNYIYVVAIVLYIVAYVYLYYTSWILL